MSQEENIIIQRLKEISPNQIYFLSHKEYFISGFLYYKQEQVLSYDWRDDRLTVIVMGRRPYAVNISCEGLTLRYTCDCPTWTASFHCKHVICALLRTVNLLSPHLFAIPRKTQTYSNDLLKNLLNKEVSSPQKQNRNRMEPYEILIDLNTGTASPTLRINGGRDAMREIPDHLQIFLSHYGYGYSQEDFLKYLNEWGNKHPIILKIKGEETTLSWDASRIYTSQTEVNVTGKDVLIRALCLLNKTVCESAYLMGDLVADLTEGTLGIVEGSSGWGFYNHLMQMFSPNSFSAHTRVELIAGREDTPFKQRSFTISLKDFQSVQINIAKEFLSSHIPQRGRSFEPDVVRDLVLKVSGNVLPIQTSQHRYRLAINTETMEDEDGYPLTQQSASRPTHLRITAECLLDDHIGMPHAPTFSLFTHIEQHRLPSVFRTKKRKGRLVDLFLSLLLSAKTRSDANAMTNDALASESTNRLEKEFVQISKKILKRFFSNFLKPDLRLQIDEKQWHLIPNNKFKEAALYQIPCKYFGPQIFYYGMTHYNEMLVPAELLHEKLALFHSELLDCGIELFYNGNPIIPSKWDFSFDARRDTTGIDWFEIKPEIKCDGVSVDEVSWRRMLEGGGVIEKDGVVHILDDQAHQILKSLGAIYKMANKTKVGKKEIVGVPRLQMLDWITLRNQGVAVLLSDEDEALMTRLTEFTKIEPEQLPCGLAADLRPYQQDSYHWLAFLYRHRFGACLADDMGLGKTLQAINFLGGIKEGIIVATVAVKGPHLIVLPPSLLFNWESEIARFYPNLKIYFYVGLERNISFDDYDVVITTYGLIRRDIKKLKDIFFNVIIFDEAQAIKNIYADTTCAARQLQGYFKLVMTGTPLENHLGEYYSLIDLCLPGLLGEYDPFKSQLKLDASPALNVLIRRTRPFVMRRTKEAVLKDLPPKTETDVYLELTDRQKVLYQQTVAQIRSTIDEAYQRKNHAQARIIALTAILKLRQLCISPRLLTHNTEEPSPKINFLMGQLHELMGANHSALVFSQFTSFLDILEESLKLAKIPFSRLDGGTATGKRKGLVEGFQREDRASVFLLSLKAGGQGLNLTKASYVFHLDPWWNPAVENQATDRAHRIGQTQKVSITRILMRHTIEEKMMVLKQKKMALYEAVMGDPEKAGKGFSISKSDFDFLLDA